MASPKSMTLSELIAYQKQLASEGKTNNNSKEATKVYKLLQENPSYHLINGLEKEVVALDRQLSELGKYLSLTDAEIDSILQKAIEEVQPYYDRKTSEIEAQLKEGKVRTAEDTLLFIREMENETSNILEQYDLTTAKTEEEFVNRLGALTSTTEDEIETKTTDWRQRIENVKFNQIQQGIFSSGIGGKKRGELEEQQGQEVGYIENRAAEEQAALETGKKYNLENIQLAREAAQQRRIHSIGTPDETDAQKEAARQALGITGDVGSEAEVGMQRTERGTAPLYNKNALVDLEEEKRNAVLSRQEELKSQQSAERETASDRQRELILAERAKKASQLRTYGF